MTLDRRFPAVTESVPDARRFVLEALSDVPGELLQRIAVMVSELATNAVVHAGAEFEVVIERDNGRISISVSDAGVGAPELRTPTTAEPHGRGLHIVKAFATNWGVAPAKEGAGKSVWFTVDEPITAKCG